MPKVPRKKNEKNDDDDEDECFASREGDPKAKADQAMKKFFSNQESHVQCAVDQVDSIEKNDTEGKSQEQDDGKQKEEENK